MKTLNFSKWIRISVAGCLLVIGVIGIVLPVLHGILFLLSGLVVLSVDFPWMRRQTCKMEQRVPAARGWLRRSRSWLAKLGVRTPNCPYPSNSDRQKPAKNGKGS